MGLIGVVLAIGVLLLVAGGGAISPRHRKFDVDSQRRRHGANYPARLKPGHPLSLGVLIRGNCAYLVGSAGTSPESDPT